MPLCPYCEAELTLPGQAAKGHLLVACQACLNPVALDSKPAGIVSTPIAGVEDVRSMAPPGSMGGALLAGIKERADNLPVLPKISRRVLLMVRDPETSMQDLGEVIAEDPVIAGKVLRVANSATYGGLSKISDIGAACARLGMQMVANTVQTAANGQLFASKHKAFHDLMHRLQVHSVVTGHCAHEIAKAIADPNADAAFVAGLLHAIGAVPLLDAVASTTQEPLLSLQTNPSLLEELLEAYYPLAGLLVVQTWRLPPELMASTYFHAIPERDTDSEHAVLSHIVSLASAIADVSGFGAFSDAGDRILMGHPSTTYLGLTDIKLAAIRVDLDDRVAPLLEVAA